MQSVMAQSVRANPCVQVLAPSTSQFSRCASLRPRMERRVHLTRRAISIRAAAVDDTDIGVAGKAAIAGGLIGSPIMLLSSYCLATTGDGFPPGPGGAYGAAEGVSYLAVVAIIGWSVYTKVSTGSGLPAGPSGLLGASEGFSYLALLAAIAAFAVKTFA